jgi:hypothetical protein
MQRILLMLALLGVITSQKPVTTVTGTVFDNRGNRIHGVTITEKRTKNGTVTDVDGHYSITVFDEWSVLEFAFIGYVTKEEKVGTRIKINVVLEEDLQSLDEVVVIGYGTQSKHSLVGAVSRSQSKMSATGAVSRCVAPSYESTTIEYVGEDYADIEENKFMRRWKKRFPHFL